MSGKLSLEELKTLAQKEKEREELQEIYMKTLKTPKSVSDNEGNSVSTHDPRDLERAIAKLDSEIEELNRKKEGRPKYIIRSYKL